MTDHSNHCAAPSCQYHHAKTKPISTTTCWSPSKQKWYCAPHYAEIEKIPTRK